MDTPKLFAIAVLVLFIAQGFFAASPVVSDLEVSAVTSAVKSACTNMTPAELSSTIDKFTNFVGSKSAFVGPTEICPGHFLLYSRGTFLLDEVIIQPSPPQDLTPQPQDNNDSNLPPSSQGAPQQIDQPPAGDNNSIGLLMAVIVIVIVVAGGFLLMNKKSIVPAPSEKTKQKKKGK